MKQFKFKQLSNKDLVIEGWANRAIVDRGNDMIMPEAWNIEQFKKNPIMLFNHDMNKPIGKVMDCKPMDGGLFVKCKISKSSDPTISMVRDLIQEGILNSFSVGFESKEQQKAQEGGHNEISKAELYEVSVVSIPMNQDSQFSLSTKSFENKDYKTMKLEVLNEKGAYVASAVQARLEQLAQESQDFDKEKVLAMVAEKAGVGVDVIKEVIAGNVTPVSPEVISALAEVLELDIEQLNNLNKEDVDQKNPEDAGVNKANEDLKAEYEAEAKATESESEGNPPSWVTDEAKWEEAKKISEDSYGEILYPFVVWLYLNKLGGQKKMLQQKAEMPIDDNPYLQEARQSNVLLALVIDQLKIISESLSKQVNVPKEQPEVEVEQEQEPVAKMLASANMKVTELKKRISALGLAL